MSCKITVTPTALNGGAWHAINYALHGLYALNIGLPFQNSAPDLAAEAVNQNKPKAIPIIPFFQILSRN